MRTALSRHSSDSSVPLLAHAHAVLDDDPLEHGLGLAAVAELDLDLLAGHEVVRVRRLEGLLGRLAVADLHRRGRDPIELVGHRCREHVELAGDLGAVDQHADRAHVGRGRSGDHRGVGHRRAAGAGRGGKRIGAPTVSRRKSSIRLKLGDEQVVPRIAVDLEAHERQGVAGPDGPAVGEVGRVAILDGGALLVLDRALELDPDDRPDRLAVGVEQLVGDARPRSLGP